jgi:3-hydroxy acid dehydrogenase/malonic semialdehyde reductase
VVLITGATAGIGMACAWQFAEQGSKLILLGRREDRLEELKKAITTEYPDVKVLTVAMSVTDKQKVAELPSVLPSEFSKVYCLVNNAGLVLGVSTVEGNNVENAQTVLDTNVIGIISMCSAFLPGMKERGEVRYIYKYVFIHMYLCIDTYMYVHIHVYIHVYIRTYL